jgi:uncharacterized membrane protein
VTKEVLVVPRVISRFISVTGVAGALVFLYLSHPAAGWVVMAGLAALTAAWRTGRITPAALSTS